MAKQIVVHKYPKQAIPLDYLTLAMKSHPQVGYSLVFPGKGLVAFHTKASDPAAVFTSQAAVEDHIIFSFSEALAVDSPDRQPFVVLKDKTDKNLVAAFIEGDLLEKYVHDGHTPFYNFKEDYLIPKLEEYYGMLSNDLDKLMAVVQKENGSFVKEIGSEFAKGGSCTFLFSTGKHIEVCKHGNTESHTYPWGHTTDMLGFLETPEKVKEPEKVVDDDPLAALLTAPTKPVTEAKAPITPPISADSLLIPAAEKVDLPRLPYNNYQEYCDFMYKEEPEKYPLIYPSAELQARIKKDPNDRDAKGLLARFYKTQMGHKVPNFESCPGIHPIGQKNELRVQYDEIMAKRKADKAALNPKPTVTEKIGAVGDALLNALVTKKEKPVDRQGILSAESKENIKAWLDKQSMEMPDDPAAMQARENGLNRFSAQAGVGWEATLGIKRSAFKDLVLENANAAINLAMEWQLELLKFVQAKNKIAAATPDALVDALAQLGGKKAAM
jgi:hypothetical protein